jgi:hypothetical protein
VKFSIFDAQGKKVIEKITYNGHKEALFEEFQPPTCRAGVYLVKIQTDVALIVKRVVLR